MPYTYAKLHKKMKEKVKFHIVTGAFYQFLQTARDTTNVH